MMNVKYNLEEVVTGDRATEIGLETDENNEYMFYVIDELNNDVDVFQFDSLDKAIDKADIIWRHLTNRERLNRKLVVAFGTPTREEAKNGYLPAEGYDIYHKYEW